MIPPDHQQVLAGRSVPAERIIVQAVIGNIDAIDNGITYRSTALDHSPAHATYVVTEN